MKRLTTELDDMEKRGTLAEELAQAYYSIEVRQKEIEPGSEEMMEAWHDLEYIMAVARKYSIIGEVDDLVDEKYMEARK